MTSPSKEPHFVVLPTVAELADIASLAAHGADVVAAAVEIVDDLAYGRVTGKALGTRNISGDLTGYARVKFDVTAQRPQRFRLVYRQVDETTREIVAVGLRDHHAIYRRRAPGPRRWRHHDAARLRGLGDRG